MKFFLVLLFNLFLISRCTPVSTQKIILTPPPYGFDKVQIADSLKYLFPALDSVHYYDQIYRRYKNVDTAVKYKKAIQYYDSLNLKFIEQVIEKHGILGAKDVGFFGNSAIFLTIQHADLATQEKYLPLFREALIKKAITYERLAMLEDRVELRNKRLQIYGTQVMQYSNTRAELYPVLNVDSLDQRRFAIGFKEPIAIYLKQFGIKWNIKKYKEKLPALIKKYGIK